jgi:hypothetical protein
MIRNFTVAKEAVAAVHQAGNNSDILVRTARNYLIHAGFLSTDMTKSQFDMFSIYLSNL